MLPNLPKKIKHKESDFGTKIFKPWVHDNIQLFSKTRGATFELKDAYEKDYLPFNAIEDIQIDAGMSIKWSKKGYLVRVLAGTVGAPDYCLYYNSPAFIVINYPKGFVIIDIETFIEEKKRSSRKSLTWDRAVIISWRHVDKKQ